MPWKRRPAEDRNAVSAKDGTCVLTVDDGPGIAAATHEKLLQPFFTTKTQGTGLGLAIVARRVAEVGGSWSGKAPVRRRGQSFAVSLLS